MHLYGVSGYFTGKWSKAMEYCKGNQQIDNVRGPTRLYKNECQQIEEKKCVLKTKVK